MLEQKLLVLLIAICAFRVAWACLMVADDGAPPNDGFFWARVISIVVNVAIALTAAHYAVGLFNG